MPKTSEVNYGKYGPIKNGKLETKNSLLLKAISKLMGILCIASLIVLFLGLFTPLMPLSLAVLGLIGVGAFFTGSAAITTAFLATTFKSPPCPPGVYDYRIVTSVAPPAPKPNGQAANPGCSPYKHTQLIHQADHDSSVHLIVKKELPPPTPFISWFLGLFSVYHPVPTEGEAHFPQVPSSKKAF